MAAYAQRHCLLQAPDDGSGSAGVKLDEFLATTLFARGEGVMLGALECALWWQGGYDVAIVILVVHRCRLRTPFLWWALFLTCMALWVTDDVQPVGVLAQRAVAKMTKHHRVSRHTAAVCDMY